MKPLSDKENLAFMTDPCRMTAQKNLDEAVKHIQSDVKSDGSAQYYLTVMPPLLKRLEEAYNNLIVAEGTILAEMEEMQNEKGNVHGEMV